jgi:hypothetical protein
LGLNENLQEKIANWLEAQTKMTDLKRNLIFAKIYLVLAGLFLLVWLWPKIQQLLTDFIG